MDLALKQLETYIGKLGTSLTIEEVNRMSWLLQFQYMQCCSQDCSHKKVNISKLAKMCSEFIKRFTNFFENDTYPVDKKFITCLEGVENFFKVDWLVEGFVPILDQYMEIILDPSVGYWTVYEIVTSSNKIFAIISNPIKHDFFREHSLNVYKLMDMLCICGDFCFQEAILKLIIRLHPDINDVKLTEKFFPDDALLQLQFMTIRPQTFNVDARTFLNVINGKNKTVFSTKAVSVMGDSSEIEPPEFYGRGKDMWIDFNLKSGSISFHCASNSISSGLPVNYLYHETVFIYKKVVEMLTIKNDKKSLELIIDLSSKMSTVLLSSKHFTEKCRSVKIVLEKNTRHKELINRYLPNIFGDLLSGDMGTPTEMDHQRLGNFESMNYKPLTFMVKSTSVSNVTSLSVLSFPGMRQELCGDEFSEHGTNYGSVELPNIFNNDVTNADGEETILMPDVPQDEELNVDVCNADLNRLTYIDGRSMLVQFSNLDYDPYEANEIRITNLEDNLSPISSWDINVSDQRANESLNELFYSGSEVNDNQDRSLGEVFELKNKHNMTVLRSTLESISDSDEYLSLEQIILPVLGKRFDRNANVNQGDLRLEIPTKINKSKKMTDLSKSTSTSAAEVYQITSSEVNSDVENVNHMFDMNVNSNVREYDDAPNPSVHNLANNNQKETIFEYVAERDTFKASFANKKKPEALPSLKSTKNIFLDSSIDKQSVTLSNLELVTTLDAGSITSLNTYTSDIKHSEISELTQQIKERKQFVELDSSIDKQSTTLSNLELVTPTIIQNNFNYSPAIDEPLKSWHGRKQKKHFDTQSHLEPVVTSNEQQCLNPSPAHETKQKKRRRSRKKVKHTITVDSDIATEDLSKENDFVQRDRQFANYKPIPHEHLTSISDSDNHLKSSNKTGTKKIESFETNDPEKSYKKNPRTALKKPLCDSTNVTDQRFKRKRKPDKKTEQENKTSTDENSGFDVLAKDPAIKQDYEIGAHHSSIRIKKIKNKKRERKEKNKQKLSKLTIETENALTEITKEENQSICEELLHNFDKTLNENDSVAIFEQRTQDNINTSSIPTRPISSLAAFAIVNSCNEEIIQDKQMEASNDNRQSNATQSSPIDVRDDNKSERLEPRDDFTNDIEAHKSVSKKHTRSNRLLRKDSLSLHINSNAVTVNELTEHNSPSLPGPTNETTDYFAKPVDTVINQELEPNSPKSLHSIMNSNPHLSVAEAEVTRHVPQSPETSQHGGTLSKRYIDFVRNKQDTVKRRLYTPNNIDHLSADTFNQPEKELAECRKQNFHKSDPFNNLINRSEKRFKSAIADTIMDNSSVTKSDEIFNEVFRNTEKEKNPQERWMDNSSVTKSDEIFNEVFRNTEKKKKPQKRWMDNSSVRKSNEIFNEIFRNMEKKNKPEYRRNLYDIRRMSKYSKKRSNDSNFSTQKRSSFKVKDLQNIKITRKHSDAMTNAGLKEKLALVLNDLKDIYDALP